MVPVVAVLVFISGGSAQGASNRPIKPVISLKAEAFNLNQVRLLDGPFKDAMVRDRNYVMAMDPDRLLHMFRVTAGLPSAAKPLAGWESPENEVRGHSMGHYLSACAMLYADTGDKAVKSRVDIIVSELAKCQAALAMHGSNPGYLAAFPESFYDRCDNLQPVSVPWYTCHKIMAGMLDVYVYTGNKQALDVVEKMAAWVKFRTDRLSEDQMQKTLNNEYGGMGEVMASIYAATGNPDYLTVASRFDKKWFFDTLSKGIDNLSGLHSNTHIPQIIAAAREYEMSGSTKYRNIASFFWSEVVDKRCYATGGTSDGECWIGPPGKLAGQLSTSSQETCCTYNMLKLTKHMIEWTADPHCADYYERALYNSILPTQSPETGGTMYYVDLTPGGWKLFNTPNDTFWCCSGTGLENHARYGEAIYFHDAKSIYINLFIPSVLTWKEKGMVLRQETKFPEEDKMHFTFTLNKPTRMALKVRVPYWIKKGATLSINGKKQSVTAKPSSYITVDRVWKSGDMMVVRLPISLHLDPMPDEPKLAAIMYGPIILAGEFGADGLTREMQYSSWMHKEDKLPHIIIPDLVSDSLNLDDWIKPVPGKPLTFRTKGAGIPEDVTLIPFYKLFGERYSVYWWKYSKAQYEEHLSKLRQQEEARKAMESRRIDFVIFGDTKSEAAHDVKSELSNFGVHKGLPWRDTNGGWFSADLEVAQDQPQTLRCVYWGPDVNRKFSISVDGTVICHESFNGDRSEGFFGVEYKLPKELLIGKQKITVRFLADTGAYAGGIFEAAVLNEQL